MFVPNALSVGVLVSYTNSFINFGKRFFNSLSKILEKHNLTVMRPRLIKKNASFLANVAIHVHTQRIYVYKHILLRLWYTFHLKLLSKKL